jgi:hypothetical protein
VAGDGLHLEGGGIDTVQATRIDRHHLAAVGPSAFGKGLNAAGGTEEMMDDVLVELIVARSAIARYQPEVRGRNEAEQPTELAAARAVAPELPVRSLTE